jgi:hypothetical protein
MADHRPDSRTLHFAGDVNEDGQPLPITVEVLRARTGKWPRSSRTPAMLRPCWLAHVRCS